MSGDEREVHGRLVGNRGGNPYVSLPVAVLEELGLEKPDGIEKEDFDHVFVHVEDGRAIVTPGWDEPARVDGGTRTAGEVDTGGTVAVRFDEEALATARERLPADADARDARDVLADLAELDEDYRTADGRDAIAAVLADTDE